MLKLREDQIVRLGQEVHASFERRCVAFLDHHLPDARILNGAEELENSVRRGVQSAAFFGCDDEQSICLYIYLTHLIGENFDITPEHAWLSPILGQAGLSASQQLDAAIDALAERLDEGGFVEVREGEGDE